MHFVNLSSEDMVLEQHMVIVSLEPLGESSIETEISHIMIDAEDERKLSCALEIARFVCSPAEVTFYQR